MRTWVERQTHHPLGYMEQLYTFGKVDRDPRDRVISVAYFALINLTQAQLVQGGTDAICAEWFDIKKLPALAFDHKNILNTAETVAFNNF